MILRPLKSNMFTPRTGSFLLLWLLSSYQHLSVFTTAFSPSPLKTRLSPLTLATPVTIKTPQFTASIVNKVKTRSATPLYFSSSSSGDSIKDWQTPLPSPNVLKVIEAKPENVIASDVAAAAGISLSQARRDLTNLAALTQGDLSVSNDGELLYTFPRNLQGVLSQRSLKFRTLEVWQKVWPTLFWLLRVGFGVTLLVSLFAIFSTIFFLQSSSSNSDDRRRDDNRGFGGGGGGLNFYFGPSPLDFFYYRPYGAYGYAADFTSARPPEMGFLESVFSYIFGDGNPNANIEELRLQKAAQRIRENRGVVTAEQLAPFVQDVPSVPSKSDENSILVEESFVLPIVTALNGEPQVTPDGDIVYVFPELQTTSVGSNSPTSRTATNPKEAWLLQRAGLDADATNRDLQRMLLYNGYDTRGIRDRKELMRVLERALPEPTPSEERELMAGDDDIVLEREYEFSVAPATNRFLAGILGAVNLGGALYLGNLLQQYAFYNIQLPSFMGVVQTLYPWLLAYAALFNVIPLVRNFWINQQNVKIRERNEKRLTWKERLQSILPRSPLGNKLQSAQRYQTQVKKLGASKNDIWYDTRQNIEQVEARKQQDELDDFDRKLRQ